MARVLMLVTNEYRPDPGCTRRRALIDGGHGVTVAAWDRQRARPPREVVEGVRLHRVRTGRVGGQLALVLNYPLFLLRCLAAAREVRPEIVHAHDLDTLPAGLLISRLRGVPIVYDAHERYAKMIAMDVPAAVSRLVEKLEQTMLPRVDLAITINEAMAAEMERHTRDKVLVIMNVIELPPRSRTRQRENESIVLFNPVTFSRCGTWRRA